MSEDPQSIAVRETIKALAKPVQDFISAVVGEPGKELGGWIADGIRGKRIETQVKVFQKAQKLTSAAGIKPKAINMKLLVPLLENGSLEDEDNILDMWAHLLANASVSQSVRSSYAAILKELEPVEAQIMQFIYLQLIEKYGIAYEPQNEYAGVIEGNRVQDAFNLSNPEFEQAIDNLYRLRLLAPPATRLEFVTNKEMPFASYTKVRLGVTYLGFYFAKACNDMTSKNFK